MKLKRWLLRLLPWRREAERQKKLEADRQRRRRIVAKNYGKSPRYQGRPFFAADRRPRTKKQFSWSDY